MKIAILLPQLDKAGGVERVITYLANYWVKQRYEIIIITFNLQPSIYYDLDLAIKRYSLFNKQITILPIINVLTVIFNLRKLLKIHQPNIAIGVDIKANLALGIASIGLNNLISIATEHRHPPTVPMPKYLLKIARFFCSSMHAMVALTQESQMWFQKNTSFKHVALIPNPLIYPLPVSNPIIKPETIINNKKYTLLAVGRLHELKRFDLLISVFNKLVIKHNNWQLVILGEGEKRIKLEQQVKQLNLQSKVFFSGSVGNLDHWYKHADLLVLASKYEGFGCVLIEAMAYAVPAVSFDCPTGPKNIITHGVDGLLVEDGNKKELFKYLDKLISNKELRQQFATEAIQVRECFSINKIGSQWLQLFKDLI